MPDKHATDKAQVSEPQIKITRHTPEAVPADALMSLQGTIGNAAVGRLLGARQRARDEKPTPVSAQTQSAIDAQSGGGEVLTEGFQQEMESAAGGSLAGVRIHRDPESDALARSLDANAFTQGRDVYLRRERDPATLPGRETLVHELTHVAHGAPQAGAVMREPYQMTTADRGIELSMSLGSGLNTDPSYVNYTPLTGGESGHFPTVRAPGDPPVDDKPTPITPATWDIGVQLRSTIWEERKGLTKDKAFEFLKERLKSSEFRLGGYKDTHKAVLEHREDHPIVGFISDKLGGVDPPPIGIWDEVDVPLNEARQAVGFSAYMAVEMMDVEATKKQKAEAKAEQEKYIDRGPSYDASLVDRFTKSPYSQTTPEAEKQRLQDDAHNALIEKAATAIGRAERQMMVKDKVVFYYKEGTEQGAERAVKVLEVTKEAGKVAAVVATGGAAAELELGIVGTSALMGVGGGTYSAGQEVAQQTGEMIFGDRTSFDWAKVAKVGVKAAVVNFVGGLAGGAFGKFLGNALGRMVGGIPAETMAAYGITGQQLLTNGERYFVMWVANTATSPFGTAAGAVMDRALEGKWTVTSMDQFFDMALHDMVVSGAIGGFFTFVHAQSTPTEAPAGGGGGGAPEPPAGGGGGGEPTGTGGGGGRTTQQGMGAAGPAGEGAPPRATTTTQQGMGAAGPAGEGATPAAPTEPMPAARTTQQGQGAAGPAGEGARPASDIGSADTQNAPGNTVNTGGETVNTEAPRNANARPRPAAAGGTWQPRGVQRVVNDPVEAAQIFREQSHNGRPVRILGGRDRAVVQDVWEHDYQQSGEPPAAWIDSNGNIVIDASKVQVPLTEAQTPQGPVRPPEGGGAGGAEGGGTSGGGGTGGTPPAGTTQQGMGAAGPAGEGAAARPASTTQPGVGAAGPAGEGAAPAQPAAGTQQGVGAAGPAGQGARPADIGTGDTQNMPGDTVQTGGKTVDTEAPRSAGRRPAGGGGTWQAKGVQRVVNDPVEASQIYYEQSRAGRPTRLLGGRDRAIVQDVWEHDYGQAGEPPPAWIDSDGNIVIDASKVQVPLTGNNVPQGPVRPGGGGGTEGGGGAGGAPPTETPSGGRGGGTGGGGGTPEPVSGTADTVEIEMPPENMRPPQEGPETPKGPSDADQSAREEAAQEVTEDQIVEERPAQPEAPPIEIDMPLMMNAEELTGFVQRLFNRPVESYVGRARFYDSYADYVAEYQRAYPGQTPQSEGYYNPTTDVLHIGPGGNMRMVVHEAVHALARARLPNGRALLGEYLDEGITDMLVLSRVGPDPVELGYRRNIDFAEYLSERLGRDNVENAILDGNFDGLRGAVRNVLGSEEATIDFFNRLRQMPVGGNPDVETYLRNMLDAAILMRPPANPAAPAEDVMVIDENDIEIIEDSAAGQTQNGQQPIPGDDGTVSDTPAPGEEGPQAVSPPGTQKPSSGPKTPNGSGPPQGEQTQQGQKENAGIHDEPTQIISYREGVIRRGLQMGQAYETYYDMIGRDTAREAGIWEDAHSGECVVIQGGPDFVSGEQLFHGEEFQHGSWRFVEHYQPGDEFFVRFPSGKDFRLMLRPQMNYGNQPRAVSSRIFWFDPGVGDWVLTEYGYTPGAERPFWIRYRNAEGVYTPEEFPDVPWNVNSAYDKFLQRFGARAATPTKGGGGGGR